MAVSVDTVSPTSAGSHSATSPLTISHTCGASATWLFASVAVDASSDGGATISATYNSVNMPSVLRWESGGTGKVNGFVNIFGLQNPTTGSAQNIVVTVTGSIGLAQIAGAGISFNGVGSLSATQHNDSAGVSVTSGKIDFTGSGSSSNLVFGVMCCGSNTITAWTGGTQRYLVTGTVDTDAAGATAAGTIPSNGGTATISWTQASDWFGIAAVELIASATAAKGPVVSPDGQDVISENVAMVGRAINVASYRVG